MDSGQCNIDCIFKLQPIVILFSLIPFPARYTLCSTEMTVTRRRKPAPEARNAPSCCGVVSTTLSEYARIESSDGFGIFRPCLHAENSMRTERTIPTVRNMWCMQVWAARRSAPEKFEMPVPRQMRVVGVVSLAGISSSQKTCSESARQKHLGVEAFYLAKPVVLPPGKFCRRRLAVLLIFLRISLHFTRLYHENGPPLASVARIFKHRSWAANEGYDFGKQLDLCSFAQVNS